jgi:hypothetical protein
MKHWKSGCEGMIAVNSIFASLAGALIAIIVIITTQKSLWVHVFAALLIMAFLFFVHSAENLTNALEEDDVEQYLRSSLQYNLGVVLLLISLAMILFFNGFRIIAILPVLGTYQPWIRDIYWLLFASVSEREAYKQEIVRED